MNNNKVPCYKLSKYRVVKARNCKLFLLDVGLPGASLICIVFLFRCTTKSVKLNAEGLAATKNLLRLFLKGPFSIFHLNVNNYI